MAIDEKYKNWRLYAHRFRTKASYRLKILEELNRLQM